MVHLYRALSMKGASGLEVALGESVSDCESQGHYCPLP